MRVSIVFFIVCFVTSKFSIALGVSPVVKQLTTSEPPYSLVLPPADQAVSLSNHVLLAFADYDHNRQMDTFVLDTSSGLDIRVQTFVDSKGTFPDTKKPLVTVVKSAAFQAIKSQLRPNSVVVQAIPADFNGDSLMDLVMLMAPNRQEAEISASSEQYFEAVIGFRDPQHPDRHYYNLQKFANFTEPPLLLDFNMDGISDLLAEDWDSMETLVWTGTRDNNFTSVPLALSEDPEVSLRWSQPGYSAFVDALSRDRAGIFLSLVSGQQESGNSRRLESTPSGSAHFAFYTLTEPGIVKLQMNISLPPVDDTGSIWGAPMFADWNFNGHSAMMVPHCSDPDCSDGGELWFYDYHKKEWSERLLLNSTPWGLIPGARSRAQQHRQPLSQALVLPDVSPVRGGDFTLSQWPDALLAVQHRSAKLPNSTEPLTGIALVRNTGARGHFTLQILLNASKAADSGGPVLGTRVSDVAFFGHNDEGSLSLWVTWCNTSLTTSSMPQFLTANYIQRDTDAEDAYFVKVVMLNGAFGDCEPKSAYELPYGLPVPGPTVRYVTDGTDGKRLRSRGHVLSMASFQALQLPYHVFGLASTANYLEEMHVAMPSFTSEPRGRIHEFTLIVPKTQLVINPCPLDEPSEWTTKLFLEPFSSTRVIIVMFVLFVIALIMAVTIVILMCFEIREDNRARVQDMNHFNFDILR